MRSLASSPSAEAAAGSPVSTPRAACTSLRVLPLAWTLSDLRGDDRPTADHIGLALSMRQQEAMAA